ncbi:hypothetical protein ACFLZ8_02300 [Planctomycetota bacterium]
MAEIEERHETDSSSAGIAEVLKDPFGTVAKQNSQDKSTSEAENTQLAADATNEKYQAAIREANEKAQIAQEQLQKALEESEKNKADTESRLAEAQSKLEALKLLEQSNDTTQEQDLNKSPEESAPQDVMKPWKIEKVKADSIESEDEA